jgi:serine/threonine protein kinase
MSEPAWARQRPARCSLQRVSRVWRPRRLALNHDLPDSFLAPRAFGPFRVLHQIGVGVLGPVYRAQGEADGALVAIKALRLDVPPEQAAEAATGLAGLAEAWPRQAALADMIAAGLEGETPWVALRHLESPTLDTWLREGRRARTLYALEGITALAEAIDTAHARQIVHGSLHPRDVFVDPQGVTRVTGFGIAQVLARVGIRPPVRRPYTAPEAIESAALSPGADLFALGSLAFEWLTGRRPAGLGAEAAEHFEIATSPERLAHARTVLAAMLAADPGHRPESAVAFARALTHALTDGDDQPLAGPEAAGDAPPEDALRLFATQGTLWEAPRAAESWRDDDLGTGLRSVSDSGAELAPDVELVELEVAPFELGPFQPESESETENVPPRPAAEDTLISAPTDDTVIHGGGILGLNRLESRATAPETTVVEPATIVSAPFDTGDTIRESVRRVDLEPPDSFEPTIVTPVSSEATIVGRAPVAVAEPPAEASAPPAVVLMLTLALGLAVGGAGGYLLGQRSSARERDQVLTAAPTPLDEPRLANETATPPAAAPGEAPPIVRDGAPPAAPAAPATPRSRAAAASGELIVRSMPAGAAVVIDNAWRGRTPLTLRGLPFGTHTVRVVEKGYVAETRRVSLDARVPAATVSVQLERAAPERVAAKPAPTPGAATGAVFIASRPTGAQVFVDGRLVGSTPLLVSELAPGTRAIRLEHTGHRPWTTQVSIAAGQRQRIAASLEEGSP